MQGQAAFEAAQHWAAFGPAKSWWFGIAKAAVVGICPEKSLLYNFKPSVQLNTGFEKHRCGYDFKVPVVISC